MANAELFWVKLAGEKGFARTLSRPTGEPALKELDRYGPCERKKQEVSQKIPGEVWRGHGICAKTAAVDIYAAGGGRGKGEQKNNEQRVGKSHRAGQPQAAKEEQADKGFDPGQNHGGKV